jgi:prepilin-type N-terminal cleavage/methylation domain-containing protein
MGRRAFTLIELSIVLTIIGLMVGGSFKAMQMMNERSRVSAAKEQVLGAKNAVIGFAIESPSLPSNPEFDQNLSPLQGNQVNQIMYAPANNLLVDDICAFTTTNLSVTVNNVDGSARPPIANVAFVIAHGSANRNLQTALVGNNVIVHAPSEQNIDDNATFVNRLEQYDDIVEWVTLPQLQQNVGCNDKPFRFINDRLPNAKVEVPYPSTSGTAKLEVENNESAADINCTYDNSYGIDFNKINFNFQGTPIKAGIVKFNCIAKVDDTDANNQKDEITKEFAITIDPNYNKETNATCTSDAECGGGFCVVGYGCQTGAFDVRCVDGADCKSGICYGGVCGGAIGSACNSSTQCLSGYCNGTSCDLMPSSDGNGTGGVGDTCQNVNDCQSGLHCSGSPKKCN